MTNPLDVQVGGDHYKKYKIQPIEYLHANNIPFIEGSIIKYATRWRDKGGVKDLEKIKHLVDLLIKLELTKEEQPVKEDKWKTQLPKEQAAAQLNPAVWINNRPIGSAERGIW